MAGSRNTTTNTPKNRKARGNAGTAPASTARLPMLRTSERTALKKCEFLWDVTYNRRLRGRAAPALRFGTLVHAALARYYIPGVKRGQHPARAFEELYELDLRENETRFGQRDLDQDEKWVEAGELGPAMLDNYIDEYGDDDEWEVIVTEYPFQYHLVGYGNSKFIYTGVLDGVWLNRPTKRLWIPDHKTTAGLGDSKLNYLQMDDQAGAYWSFGVLALKKAGLLRADRKLSGMLYNFLRKSMPDERPSKYINGKRIYLNKDGSVSKKQPSPYFLRQPIFRDDYDRMMTMERARNDYRRIELLRSGELPIGKNPGQFTCPSCPVSDACELHETGNDWSEFLRQTTEAWNPYEEHAIYDGR